MVAALYLVSKANPENPNLTLVDGIHACIVNADDGGSSAVTIAEAEATLQGAGYPVPDGYFDTVEQLGVPTGGIMTTDEDLILIRNRDRVDVIA